MKEVETSTLTSVVARILDNRLAKDITILNISNVSVMADYFVICSGDSSTQVRAMTGYVKEYIKKLFGRLPNGEETDMKNRWNLLDYGDVVVHVLHREERDTYAIEKFWNHGFKVKEEDWMKESEPFAKELA
ncbi:MAG: ribosome silencing factor [Candidatus Gastranaerophilales bacterium]|nr:ribosome silencing factor [Candidatus Gastranaerophilales bacterium]